MQSPSPPPEAQPPQRPRSPPPISSSPKSNPAGLCQETPSPSSTSSAVRLQPPSPEPVPQDPPAPARHSILQAVPKSPSAPRPAPRTRRSGRCAQPSPALRRPTARHRDTPSHLQEQRNVQSRSYAPLIYSFRVSGRRSPGRRPASTSRSAVRARNSRDRTVFTGSRSTSAISA